MFEIKRSYVQYSFKVERKANCIRTLILCPTLLVLFRYCEIESLFKRKPLTLGSTLDF